MNTVELNNSLDNRREITQGRYIHHIELNNYQFDAIQKSISQAKELLENFQKQSTYLDYLIKKYHVKSGQPLSGASASC